MNKSVLGTAIAAAFLLVLSGCSNDDDAPEGEDVAAVPEEQGIEPTPVPEPVVEAVVPDPVPDPVEPGPAPDPVEPEAEPIPEPVEPDPALEPDPPAEFVEVDPMAPFSGNATATESAIIILNDRRVMLYGLESMHPPQRCSIGGEAWECWAAAVRQLQTYLAESEVTCTPVEPPDFLGRVLALCDQNGESLNERYVRSGFALAIEAEVPEYAEAEAAARAEGIGLWQGAFQEPADFRESRGLQMIRP